MRIKNASGATNTWAGQQIEAGAYYQLEETEIPRWAADATVLVDVLASDLIVANPDDITDPMTGLATLRNEIPRPVETRREVKDLRLQGIGLSADADANGLCVVTVEVPATGVDQGRYIDWGEGWISGQSHADDRIQAIDVEAPDGQGGWVKVSGYCDDDAAEAGWNIPEKPAIAEVEPLGWYGFIPGGCRLKITAQCGGSAPFTGRKLKLNLGWGKRDG